MPIDHSCSKFNQYTIQVILRDGSIVQLRPIRLDDVDRLHSLFYTLRPTSVYLRFHHVLKQMSKEETPARGSLLPLFGIGRQAK